MKLIPRLAIAVTCATSFNAQAAFMTLPESVRFNINDDPTKFLINHEFDLNDNDPDTVSESVITFYTMESGSYYDWFDDGGLNINQAVSHLFLGRGNVASLGYVGEDTETGKLPIFGPVLGESYNFDVSATIRHTRQDCEGECTEGDSEVENLRGSMLISFFDDTNASQVPVSPPASLLALGLTGFAFRRLMR